MKYFLTIIVVFLLFAQVAVGQKPAAPDNGSGQVPASIVHFFPNPAVNSITFEFKAPVERGSSLQVFSFLGRQVAAVPVNTQRVTVNVSQFFKGVYVFQLRTPSGRVIETNKFQVSR